MFGGSVVGMLWVGCGLVVGLLGVCCGFVVGGLRVGWGPFTNYICS